eukprot:NODE_300_length_10433_cov_0.716470.p2 type:complete len:515 gc:universal NODE_300_length_10433_cov_0.716470:1467-3011(+)
MNRLSQFNIDAQDILPNQPSFEYPYHSVTTIAFHPGGNLIAVATEKGPIGIWELEVLDIRQLVGHVCSVTGIAWMGMHLWSGSIDMTIIEWCVELGVPKRVFRLDSPILSFCRHPIDSKTLLFNYSLRDFALLNTRSQEITKVPAFQRRLEQIMVTYNKKECDITFICKWSSQGDSLYIGDSVGEITVFNLESGSYNVKSVLGKQKGTFSITNIEVSQKLILVNASDRVLRLLNDEFVELYTFQDIVNRYPWTGCTFSNDAEYIVASGDRFNASQITIFETKTFRQVKTLNPYNEIIKVLEFHPSYHTLATITDEGKLSLHSLLSSFSWGAFEPRFKEIEENEEFQEHLELLTKATHRCRFADCDCFNEIYKEKLLKSADVFKQIFPGPAFELTPLDPLENDSKTQRVVENSDCGENLDFHKVLNDANKNSKIMVADNDDEVIDIESFPYTKLEIVDKDTFLSFPKCDNLNCFVEIYDTLIPYKTALHDYPVLPSLPIPIANFSKETANVMFEQ